MSCIPIIPHPGQRPRDDLVDLLTDERDVARITLRRVIDARAVEEAMIRMRKQCEEHEMGVLADYWDEEGLWYS